MFKKLLTHFKDSILLSNRPEKPMDQYFIFYNEAENEWIGLLKSSVSEQELQLLKSLFTLVEYEPSSAMTLPQTWYEFLLMDGPPPSQKKENNVRLIQFYLHHHNPDPSEIETALTGFFSEEVIIFWENNHQGIVIEEKSQIALTEEELIAMTGTLESDFYVKISFFIGKRYPLTKLLPSRFREERDFFAFGLAHLNSTNIFTYERIFPAYLAYHLPEEIKQKVNNEILEIFQQDPELFSTLKIFLENNLNASLTAKKLYIHRNTLQYRIDKFTEKTGLSLKDFYGAFTVFLACLLFDYQQK